MQKIKPTPLVSNHRNTTISWRKYSLVAVVWSLLIGTSLTWNIYQVHDNMLTTATAAARTNINKDMSVRKWATAHGVEDATVPLVIREITVETFSKLPLTLRQQLHQAALNLDTDC